MTNEIKAAVESLEFDVAYQGQLYYLLPEYKTRIKFVCQALRAAEKERRLIQAEALTELMIYLVSPTQSGFIASPELLRVIKSYIDQIEEGTLTVPEGVKWEWKL